MPPKSKQPRTSKADGPSAAAVKIRLSRAAAIELQLSKIGSLNVLVVLSKTDLSKFDVHADVEDPHATNGSLVSGVLAWLKNERYPTRECYVEDLRMDCN